MSERRTLHEFNKLSKYILVFFILACIGLIILAYVSLIQFYMLTKVSTNGLEAEVTVNAVQSEPTIQPVIEITLTSETEAILFIEFNETEFSKYYSSKEPTTSFKKALLLPKELFGKRITVTVGREPVMRTQLTFTVVDAPKIEEPTITIL